MISGFYMALVLSQRYAKLSNFYFNRFLRLYPTYWFLIAGATLLYLSMGQPVFLEKILNNDALQLDGKLFMIFSNLFIFGSDAMMYLYPSPDGLAFTADFREHTERLHQLHIMPQAWTLPIEMAFYIIAPFVVKSRIRLGIVILLSLFIRHLTYTYISDGDPWTYRFFPSEAAIFCIGALAFHVHKAIRDYRFVYEVGFLLFGAMLIYILNYDRVPVIAPNIELFTRNRLQLYIFVFLSLPFIFQFTRENKIDQWIGELSYPIYLSHLFVIKWLRGVPGDHVYSIVGMTLILAILIHIFVQLPIEARFKRTGTLGASNSSKLGANEGKTVYKWVFSRLAPLMRKTYQTLHLRK